MSLCGNSECFGLEPCQQCRDVRIEVTLLAVRASGMTKEQAEKFYQAYAEAFDGALMAIRSAKEALTAERLAKKEANDKAQEEERAKKKIKNGSHQNRKPESEAPASVVTSTPTKE